MEVIVECPHSASLGPVGQSVKAELTNGVQGIFGTTNLNKERANALILVKCQSIDRTAIYKVRLEIDVNNGDSEDVYTLYSEPIEVTAHFNDTQPGRFQKSAAMEMPKLAKDPMPSAVPTPRPAQDPMPSTAPTPGIIHPSKKPG